MDQTNFEQALAQYFPDIFALHQLGKSELHLWELMQLILAMRAQDVTGRIEIFYTRGHIDAVKQTIDVLAYRSTRPKE